MKRKFVFPALMLCLGILNGCGAARPSKYYQLTVPGEGNLGTDPAPYSVTLLLGPITTSNLYRDDHIVYTSEGQAMGVYEYHRWAEPPAELISDVLLRELQLSGHFQHVYSMRSDTRGDYILVDACTTSGRFRRAPWRPACLSSSNCATRRQGLRCGAGIIRTMNLWMERT